MRQDRVILYAWQDVERILYACKRDWPKEWGGIEVFSTEMYIYAAHLNEEIRNKTDEFLRGVFKNYFSGSYIIIPVTETKMAVTLCEEEADFQLESPEPFPLFKDFLYVPEENDAHLKALQGVPILAFHSYKGGVGRTLMLITFVRNLIEAYGSGKKVLIVDGDMEAPGLTWLGQVQNGNYDISYIDILNIISAKGIEERIFDEICQIIENSYLTFHNEKMSVQQFFLPTYRTEEQLLDIYSKPERIMAGERNKYIISDALSELGQKLKADMVLVDLRAGISEYSAPFLFDPRVKKIVVTSTSDQSVIGTSLLMQQLKKQRNNEISNILLTMVQKDVLSEKDRDKLYKFLILNGNGDEDGGVDSEIGKLDSIIEVPKSDEVIHLGDLDQICDRLNVANAVTKSLMDVVTEAFPLHESEGGFSEEEIEKFRENLFQITDENVTAEGTVSANLLVTKPVMQLGSFTREVPRINILGAKGAGKTYLYKQMVIAKEWSEFLRMINKVDYSKEETLVCPVLCTEDRRNFQNILLACRSNCLDKIPIMRRNPDILFQNEQKVRDAITWNFSENNWLTFWDEMIRDMFEGIYSLKALNTYLTGTGKRMIFLFDGLETLFPDFLRNDTEKKAMKALCKGFMNRLYEYQAEQIGAVIFVRRDIAEIVFESNFQQFRDQYRHYELNWRQKDALQLAWKLSDRAARLSGLKLTDDATPIYNLSQDEIENNLTKIWGKKMGTDNSKTAGTTKWVLASLSDFNGQLQARDIVRFLKFAAYEKEDGNAKYPDRLLSPEVMKRAVKSCSVEKLKEVETEIHQLKQSFQILKEIPNSKKQVPLPEEVLDKLTNEERKTLERYGYLTEAEGEYYIPESIRYALGYNKTRRGGIKLVSLLVKK